MKRQIRWTGIVLTTLCLAVSQATWADKPSSAGNGKDKGNKHHKKDGDSESTSTVNVGGINFHISDHDRKTMSEYYQGQAKSGKCPPGLAKKNNGCLPPGQAKKWARGKPIGSLEVYDLPYDLRIRLPPPPAGHKYVQTAADVLLIAVGTGMVVDAVEDLLR